MNRELRKNEDKFIWSGLRILALHTGAGAAVEDNPLPSWTMEKERIPDSEIHLCCQKSGCTGSISASGKMEVV